LIAALLGSVQQDWTWSAYPEAGFRILSPVSLVDHVIQVPTALDVISYHQYRGGSVNDSILAMAFVIDHYKLPGEIEEMEETDIREFFGNTIDPILSAVDGTLIYMDIQRKAGADVCSWKASYRNAEVIIRGESILAGNKYFGLQAFGWADHKPETLMNKFLSSFVMTDSSSK
jgi:hypothetical protein